MPLSIKIYCFSIISQNCHDKAYVFKMIISHIASIINYLFVNKQEEAAKNDKMTAGIMTDDILRSFCWKLFCLFI